MSNLLTFVTELKQCAVTPDEIAEISGKTGNKSLGKKLSELSPVSYTHLKRKVKLKTLTAASMIYAMRSTTLIVWSCLLYTSRCV